MDLLSHEERHARSSRRLLQSTHPAPSPLKKDAKARSIQNFRRVTTPVGVLLEGEEWQLSERELVAPVLWPPFRGG